MPRPMDLPDGLRPLARRSAAELRENRWRDDVDDLIEKLKQPRVVPPRQAHGGATTSVARNPSELSDSAAESHGGGARLVSGSREGDVAEMRDQSDANGVVPADRVIRATPERTVRVDQPPRRSPVRFWLPGVILLGLWPLLTLSGIPHDDQPFMVNLLIIAAGVLVLAFVWPMEPKAATKFAVVPYVLNLAAMGLFIRPEVLPFSLFFGVLCIIHLIAFAVSLFPVWAISNKRYYGGTGRPS
jgi:hypothetical protein